MPRAASCALTCSRRSRSSSSGPLRPRSCRSRTGRAGRWSAASPWQRERSASRPLSIASSDESFLGVFTTFSPRPPRHRAFSPTREAFSSPRGSCVGSASCCCCTRYGVEVGLGAALVYMIVTGLANTAPILPGNAGVYQGAALGALALVGEAGSKASCRRARRPAVRQRRHGSLRRSLGVALYGRRFAVVSRAAFGRSSIGPVRLRLIGAPRPRVRRLRSRGRRRRQARLRGHGAEREVELGHGPDASRSLVLRVHARAHGRLSEALPAREDGAQARSADRHEDPFACQGAAGALRHPHAPRTSRCPRARYTWTHRVESGRRRSRRTSSSPLRW